ncbi:MAG: hypothetical protein R3315_09005 [Woeseiaceae bacterium]|nr:hypothetical protein [Woeseiaceae bacterium]
MDFDDVVSDLKRKRDELRVQLNLGKRELQDEVDEEWREFQTKLKDFSAKAELKETRDEIGEELSELAEDLKRGYRRIRDALKD